MLLHSFVSTYPDGANANKLRPSDWNAEHVFGGGALGSLLFRDTGASNGASWLADVASGSVLVSGGVGAAPAWSATPSLTTLTLGSGSAAAPSCVISDAGGFFRYAANGLGISAGAKQIGILQYRLLNSVDDNMRFVVGTGASITNTSATAYVASITPVTPLTQTGNCAAVGLNIGNWIVNATDTTTRTGQYANVEMDYLAFSQSGGAVTFNFAQNVNIRMPFALTGVTLVDSVGLNFLMPGTDATGAITSYKAINIPAMTGSGGTNFFGIFFNDVPNGGHLATASNTDLVLRPQGTGMVRLDNFATGLGIGTAASTRMKTFTATAAVSPFDRLVIASKGASAGWRGTVDLDVSYNNGTQLNGLRVVANTDGTTTSTLIAGALTLAGGTLLSTSAALTNGAAAQTGTLTNAPTAGNPTKWIPISDNGTTRYIPAW